MLSEQNEVSSRRSETLWWAKSEDFEGNELNYNGVNGSGGISNAALIYGPSGVGKTSAVYCIASSLGFDVIEINASQARSGGAIRQLFLEATQSRHVDFGHMKNNAVTESLVEKEPQKLRGRNGATIRTPGKASRKYCKHSSGQQSILENDADTFQMYMSREGSLETCISEQSEVKSTFPESSMLRNDESESKKLTLILFEEVDEAIA